MCISDTFKGRVSDTDYLLVSHIRPDGPGRFAGGNGVSLRPARSPTFTPPLTIATVVDRDSVEALKEAEQARRVAAQSIEQGESTLAAYRRVVSPGLTPATLVNRRG